ncbi:MAG: serine hydrolase domain-containing protein [Melioribacteraceae bacterium]|nr:serine hydrolase domain-containing protein [Melioribacteraceae bacterium]
MKKLFISILYCLLLGFFILSCSSDNNPVSPDEKQFDQETVTKLETALDESLREFNVPGVIAGIWSPKGNFVKAKGVSNLTTGEPMRVDNHFRMGSVTKTFVGTVVLMLVDEGKIRLDSTLAKYLPEYKFPKADKITLRMLGNMTSGIFNYTNDKDWAKDCAYKNWDISFTADSLVKIGLKHPLNFEPGTQYEYSNTNTILLGLICEKVTGKPIYKLLEEKIFIPQALKNTYWPHNVYIATPYSHGYTRGTVGNVLTDATNFNFSWGGSAGILISNIYDLKKWVKLLNSGSLYSPAMHTERLKWANGSNSVYGFAIMNAGDEKTLILGHTGGVWGFNTYAVHLPSKDLTIIISVNFYGGTTDMPANSVFEKILKIVTPELFNSAQLKIWSNVKNSSKDILPLL